ncbi:MULTISPECIES: hypothetical protein [unclassified Massilia]|uniref:hypothetical protein n=1 Tax=unclassified Massilia TaxID=2609279 RepID=UPI000AEBDF78|nr:MULTISPECIES: hypothetical protein [unclassified Massilia]
MLQVQFASKKRRANLALVLALWHELMAEWHPEEPEPLRARMPRRSANATLSAYLNSAAWPDITREQAERACGFDIILRLASGLIDTSHSTDDFFTRADNGKWFRPVDMPSTTRKKLIRGVELTPEAIATWSGASDDERRQALGEARRLLESDLESQGIPVQLLPHAGTPGAAPSVPASTNPSAQSRTGCLEALVKDIHEQPFQRVYRKRPFGAPVKGWDDRLRAYFWPAPAQGYRETAAGMRDIAQTARALAEALAERGAWDADEQARAVALAHAVFTWGGVPQDPKTVTASTVQDVVRAALDNDADARAHMNSGWTKVAAFVTDHVDGLGTGRPQAIWDSRVATSIVDRLDGLLPAGVEPATLFPGVGTVPGRGGTRPRTLSRRWPSGYKTWAGQVAGSQVVRDIRDILNNGAYPKMPLPDGGAGAWTTRGVEMVLFMDGY